MIFYFSGTGNTRWAAIQLATATKERLVDLSDIYGRGKLSGGKGIEPFTLQEGERLGFVFPVHGWRVPRLVRNILRNITICSAHKPFAYAVCTAGDNIGLTIETLNDTLAANTSLASLGISKVDAAYSLIMPESYVGLPFMDVDTKQKEALKKKEAATELQEICMEICGRKKGVNRLTKGFAPWILTKVIGGFFEHVLITDKRFHVTEAKCVRCGICANVCPVGDIAGGKGKTPKWLHHKDCLTCFTCYHHCPHHAIEFGRQTHHKGQYFFR